MRSASRARLISRTSSPVRIAPPMTPRTGMTAMRRRSTASRKRADARSTKAVLLSMATHRSATAAAPRRHLPAKCAWVNCWPCSEAPASSLRYVRYRACPHCGCLYNRRGNARCAECHRSLLLAWLRPYRAPQPAPPPPAPEPRKREHVASLPPPSQLMDFGPRQGEPISPTGIRLRLGRGEWLSHIAVVAAMVVAALALTAAVVMAVTGHGGH
jgi:hypothetical protein